MNRTSSLLVALLIALPVSSFAQSGALVKIDGSSTVYPISEAVAEDFQKLKKNTVKVIVGISGTGGGFKKFCRGETDISDASRPILKQEMDACEQAGIQYIELPVAFDALTIVVHPENKFVDYLTVAELKKMWEPAAQGKINNWNQIRSTFPDVPLKRSGAGADSGTFDYFTEALVGKAKSSRGDYQASEDDNVTVQFVEREKGALGYFGLAYYVQNSDKMKAVAVKLNEKAPAVLPSVANVNNSTYQPLSRPIFIYVNVKSADKPEVREFVEYYLAHAGELSKEVGFVNLPPKGYELALHNFKTRKLGTGFGGIAEVGVHVEDLLKREGKM